MATRDGSITHSMPAVRPCTSRIPNACS